MAVCECGKFSVEDTNGEVFRTECDRETKGQFAPGHDAKLKSFLIKAAFVNNRVVYVADGGTRLHETAIEAASRYGFSVQVAGGIQRLMNKYTDEVDRLDATTGMGKRESKATRAVMLQLQKRYGMWESVGSSFQMDSLTSFTHDAKAWLGDKSELSGRTIDSADYQVAYEHFKTERDD